MYGITNTIKIDDGTEIQGFQVKIAYPEKAAVVRLPTNGELSDYLNQYAEQSKAKGKKPSEEQLRAPDAELFKKLKLSGDDLDEFEAESVISRLTQCSVVSTEKTPDGYTVTLTTPFGEVKHMARPLTLKELATYRTAVSRGQQNWHTSTVLSLYNTISKGTEGYAEGCEVPPHHKNMTMSEVALALFAIDPLQIIDPN